MFLRLRGQIHAIFGLERMKPLEQKAASLKGIALAFRRQQQKELQTQEGRSQGRYRPEEPVLEVLLPPRARQIFSKEMNRQYHEHDQQRPEHEKITGIQLQLQIDQRDFDLVEHRRCSNGHASRNATETQYEEVPTLGILFYLVGIVVRHPKRHSF